MRPIADPGGIDQGAAEPLTTNFHVVELGLLGMLAGFDGDQEFSGSSR